jgi:drug/metabolite transporter (DMT)-like permease
MKPPVSHLAPTFPLLFVLLWSTGFIGARMGLPHSEPLTFLFVRYVLVVALLLLLAVLSKAPWPTRSIDWWHIGVAGLFIHGVYLGGVFMAISMGLPTGVAALVVGLQPLLVAVGAGWFLNERVLQRQWLGLILGLAGVILVLVNKLGADFALQALLPCVISLLSITCGNLYQKRFCPQFDWRTGAIAQFVPTMLLTGIAAHLTESMHIDWVPEMVFAMGWLVLVLSLGAVSLLNWLIRNNNAVNVASLFYLVPPCTSMVAWLLFGETFATIALAGMGLVVWGVYWARAS